MLKSYMKSPEAKQIAEIYNTGFRAQDLTIEKLIGKSAEIMKFDVAKARNSLKTEMETIKKS